MKIRARGEGRCVPEFCYDMADFYPSRFKETEEDAKDKKWKKAIKRIAVFCGVHGILLPLLFLLVCWIVGEKITGLAGAYIVSAEIAVGRFIVWNLDRMDLNLD